MSDQKHQACSRWYFFLGYLKNLDKIGWNASISAFFSAFAVMLEPESRRSEIALFIVPRFFETLWNLMKKRKLAKPIPGGELLVFALAMGIINYFYQNDVIRSFF